MLLFFAGVLVGALLGIFFLALVTNNRDDN